MAANTYLPKRKKNLEISQVSREDKETCNLRLVVKACNKSYHKIKKGIFQRRCRKVTESIEPNSKKQ